MKCLEKNSKIFLAGHTGLVGSAISRELNRQGYNNIIGRTIEELDLRNQESVNNFFEIEKPDIVIVAAAKVGGILANDTYRADFIYDNIMIESNLISASHQVGVKKLVFLGSSCIYPKLAEQPLREESILSGYLESTNEPYALAKITGIKLCESFFRQYGCNFFSVMPTNLYGPHDNFNLNTSHVLPALIRKFHEAKINSEKSVVVWGSGAPMRELMFVEDLSRAIVFLLSSIDASDIYSLGISQINIGTGKDLSIADLAELVKKVVGFEGIIEYDHTKPDGTPKKLLDVSRIHSIGWKHQIEIEEGIGITYKWFLENFKN